MTTTIMTEHDLHALCAAVAAALGSEWRADPQPSFRVTLRNDNAGESLAIRLGTWGGENGRLCIRGAFNGEEGRYVYGMRTPDITVSRHRPAAVIAREIERRLLPDYREALAKTRERMERTNQALAKTRHTIALLAYESRGHLYPHGDDSNEVEQRLFTRTLKDDVDRPPANDYIWKASVYEDKVGLDLRGVPAALAVKIVALLYADEA